MPHKLPSLGIDALLEDEALLRSLAKRNVGLITNQSALTKDYVPSAYAIAKKIGPALKCILTPEHGWSGLVAEGVTIADGFDPHLGLPILSLYGNSRKFLDFMTKNNINTILIDLQDVGVRCYTYTSTCAKFLEACTNIPLEVIMCDRPNPLGPKRMGPALDPRFRSLVGYIDVPFQHGQTIGQLLCSFNETLGIQKFPVTRMPCQPFHHPYQYPWIPPSPNLPSWEATLLYPGLVLLEGVDISEGRGTTLPFTSLGAPGLDNYGLVDFLNGVQESGVRARPITFTPHSGSLKGQTCQGVHLLLDDPCELNALSLGIKIIHFLKETYSGFSWTKMSLSAAEVEKEGYFIDYLLGTASFREALDAGLSLPDVLEKFAA